MQRTLKQLVSRNRKTVSHMLALSLIAILAGGRVLAATAFWWPQDGEGQLWSGNNWSSNSGTFTPYTPADGDSLRFYFKSSQAAVTNDLVDFKVNGISFQSSPLTHELNGTPILWGGGQVSSESAIINLDIELNANLRFDPGAGKTITMNGVISEDDSSRVVDFNSGTVYLNGLNNYSGATSIIGISGYTTVVVNTFRDSSQAQSLGLGSRLQFGHNDNDGVVIYTGPSTTADRNFQIGRSASGNTGGGGFYNDGSGPVIWSGTQTSVTAPTDTARVFILGGSNTGDNDFQVDLSDNNNGAQIAFRKEGAGTWILSGDNSYTGPTTVTEGTLVINGNQSAAVGTISVDTGATIGGDGIVGGSLTLANGAQFLFDPLATLTVNGATVDLGALGIANLVGLDSTVADGFYPLIDGSASFDFSAVQNLGLANAFDLGADMKFAYFEAGSLNLVVTTIPEPGSLGLLGLAGLALLRRRR